MLSAKDNEALTRVGRGTPMGELMRRYWQPIAAVAQLDERPTLPVRLLGEDLVLYRDGSGAYGLLDRHCPHRRADLSYGMVEACGLRCHYHGWHFDGTGRCLEQPFEDAAHPDGRFRDKIRITAYPVEAKAGLLWAYSVRPRRLWCRTGISSATRATSRSCSPRSRATGSRARRTRSIPFTSSGCTATGRRPSAARALGRRVTSRSRSTSSSGASSTAGCARTRPSRTICGPSAACPSGRTVSTRGKFEWRVPIDDEHTLHVAWFNDPLPGTALFVQERIPYWFGPVTDPATGRYLTSHVMNQDFVAWLGQGTIADRTQEHLGESDRGVILFRKRMLEEAAIVARGGEPKAVVRDPMKNHRLELPRVRQGPGARSIAMAAEGPPRMLWHAGQPPAIAEEITRIWAERKGA